MQINKVFDGMNILNDVLTHYGEEVSRFNGIMYFESDEDVKICRIRESNVVIIKNDKFIYTIGINDDAPNLDNSFALKKTYCLYGVTYYNKDEKTFKLYMNFDNNYLLWNNIFKNETIELKKLLDKVKKYECYFFYGLKENIYEQYINYLIKNQKMFEFFYPKIEFFFLASYYLTDETIEFVITFYRTNNYLDKIIEFYNKIKNKICVNQKIDQEINKNE